MLLRTAALERIVRGEVSLVFRRWRRPTVRTGGSLHTALGVLHIIEVAAVEESGISDADAEVGRLRLTSRAAQESRPPRGTALSHLGGVRRAQTHASRSGGRTSSRKRTPTISCAG